MKFCFKSLFCFCAAFVACFLLLGARAADAQCVAEQTHKLLADDGAAQDHFGTSVAVNETTAIVGAIGDFNHVNAGPGSAYVFDTATGQQLHKLLPNDSAAGDRFGISVAISGTIALVGAHEAAGSAYVFDLSTGQQIAQFFTDDGAWDNFGASVAISGTTAIIGAAFDDDNGSNSGSAYLFDLTTMEQIAKLHPSDPSSGDFFGNSVAISGTTAIVGCNYDGDNGQSSGSAYLFDTVTGQQLHKLLPVDGAAWDWFGTSVGISGTTAIVSAPGDGDNGEDSGSAYLFDTTTGQQLRKLLPDDGAADDDFGGGGTRGVAISGSTAIVGARYDDDNGNSSGSAYLFDTTTGQQIDKLLPDDGAQQDRFGFSVSISETTVVVGALWDDDNGEDSGSAFVFDTSCLEVVTADSFLVTRGTHVAGGVVELAESDNADLSIWRATADSQSRTEFEVKAVSPTASPSSLEVTLEGSVFARSQVDQTIELFDYVAGNWEQVDTRAATRFSDSTVTVATTGNLSRFVEAGTMCIEARIRYQSTNPRQQFSSNTDQFLWTIGQ